MGGSRFFVDRNVILSVTQDHMQKFEILQPIFNFFTPQYLIVRGVVGGLDFYSDWNVIFSVTQEPLQNFKTVAQTLLAETAHFGLFQPKIGFFRGVWGVPEI